MAAISRLVAIGRRMKISEMFTSLAVAGCDCRSPACAILDRCRPRRARVRRARRVHRPPPRRRRRCRSLHSRACSSRSCPSVTTVSPGFSPFRRRRPRHALSDRDRPLLDGRIRLDDEDKLAVLAGLHRLLRHHGRRAAASRAADDARELAGPQAAILFRKRRLELDRVRRRCRRRCRRRRARRWRGCASPSCGAAVTGRHAFGLCGCLMVARWIAGTVNVT